MPSLHHLLKRSPQPAAMDTSSPSRASMSPDDGFLEAWAQGFNIGSLIVLILIVTCNYRGGIGLHKLILLELVLALPHGTFIFFHDPTYGWYLSSTATLLFASYQVHNIVSWLKIKPFLPRWGSYFFIITLIAVQPFWVVEAWSNFEYFNHLGSKVNVRIRPWEALLRDPWWIFTTWRLIGCIKKSYGFDLIALVKINRRFGVLLGCMFLSIIFLVTDIAVSAARVTVSSGINPFWRYALVFKCASDTIFLDDFKSVLDDIVAHRFGGMAGGSRHRAQTGSHTQSGNNQSRAGKRPVGASGLGSQLGTQGSSSAARRNSSIGGVAPHTQMTSSSGPTSSKRPSVVKWLDPFRSSHSRKASRSQIQQTTEMVTRSEVWDEGQGQSGSKKSKKKGANPPPSGVLTRIERASGSRSPRASKVL